MDFKLFLQIILVLLGCSILLENNGIQGDRLLSGQEDLELEEQLKHINKPAVKTIQVEYGDTYDCVDFFKQPAFDHPLLKNHNFHPQMRPNFIPKKDKYTSIAKEIPYLGLKGGGCPTGTVPIRRVTKDDLIREKLMSLGRQNLTQNIPGTHYAVVRTKQNANRIYHGASGVFTIYNPTVEENQYSSAQIKVQNDREIITAGWTVNPMAYNDHNTRSFIYTEADGSKCFNTRCAGFVLVRNDIPLDIALPPPINQKVYLTGYALDRDNATGNWWLQVGNGTIVGFWPGLIFKKLSQFAHYIEWGGEVHSPSDVPSPPMGSSRTLPPLPKISLDAHCRHITVANESLVIVNPTDIEEYTDAPNNYYQVNDVGLIDKASGYMVFFGGVGGMTGN